MKAIAIALLVMCASAGAQPAAPTPEQKDEAKALYEKGSKHYDLREYREAVDAFRKAYDLLPDPLFLFNIAQAYRLLDDCENARMFYKSYLRNEPTADNRVQSERFITAMDACIEKRAAEREEARKRETKQVTVVTRSDRSGARLAGIITSGLGALVVGGGVYFSLDANKQARAVEQLCESGCATSDVAAIDRQGLDSERDAIILYAIGGAAVATGVGLIIYSALGSGEPVVVTPAPGGVSATVRF